jgi:hypothetical protein
MFHVKHLFVEAGWGRDADLIAGVQNASTARLKRGARWGESVIRSSGQLRRQLVGVHMSRVVVYLRYHFAWPSK